MPTEMLIKEQHRASPGSSTTDDVELRRAARRQVERVHRSKLNAAAWALGTVVLTTLWIVVEWQANGAFESFGHEGETGQWNPTLWALAVGIWGLVVGIMALRAYVERPATAIEIHREVERLKVDPRAEGVASSELRRAARARLERIRRLQFHVAAWVLGMVVLTPLWVLIEWQDNGGFERWSDNSRPGDWDPWILYVGGISVRRRSPAGAWSCPRSRASRLPMPRHAL